MHTYIHTYIFTHIYVYRSSAEERSNAEDLQPPTPTVQGGSGIGGGRLQLLSRVPLPVTCADISLSGAAVRQGGGGGVGVRGRGSQVALPQWENVVFSGGGVKVLAFVKALLRLWVCLQYRA